MQRLCFIILLSAAAAHNAEAQNKELRKDLSQARTYIKSGKDLDKAIKLMTDQMAKNETARRSEKVYLTWFEAVEKLYAQGNEKLYLKQTYDTAQLFQYAKEMFDILEGLDSLAAGNVKKAGDKVNYRGKHAQLLNTYRPNLFYGGTFFIRRNDYKTAYSLLSTYLDCAEQPLFADNFDYMQTDTLMPYTAYLAAHCGYKLNDAGKILRHMTMARRDNAHLPTVTQYAAEAYRMQQDTTQYIATLRRGFRQFTRHPYFFTYLHEWYTGNNMPDEALTLCNDALQQDSTWQLVLLAKSSTLLNMERNSECIEVSDRLLQLNDSIADAWFYAGTAYLNEALITEKQYAGKRKDKAALTAIYRKAMPYMENYRRLCPDDKQRWAPALYRIYLNLNMGTKFDEIDKIINQL